MFAISPMGKKGPAKGHSAKRPFPTDGDCNSDVSEQTCSKKLLSNNQYAVLPEEGVEKKGKIPPFYTKGFPDAFLKDMNTLISRGLKATFRYCTDGYKIVVPSEKDYRAVEDYLRIKEVEYFTHDFQSMKPLKVVIRGLPDMDVEELKNELVNMKLKPLTVYKINRHNKNIKFRDQLYLVHLEKGSITMSELKQIRSLCYIIIEWERYKPVHRDVTQCSNCQGFGHGTKNCHLKPRCGKCAGDHTTGACGQIEGVEPTCINCGGKHLSSNRECSKRAEFIQRRNRAATNNKAGPIRPPPPAINSEVQFPFLHRAPIPVLPPLPLNQPRSNVSPVQQRFAAAVATGQPPPQHRSSTRVPNAPTEELYTAEEMATLFLQLDQRTRACRNKQEQITVMMLFYYQHGQLLSEAR